MLFFMWYIFSVDVIGKNEIFKVWVDLGGVWEGSILIKFIVVNVICINVCRGKRF